jgi:hypothetical protein
MIKQQTPGFIQSHMKLDQDHQQLIKRITVIIFVEVMIMIGPSFVLD